MENAWLAGQVPTILPYFITQRMPPASTLVAGIQVPTRILHSSVSIRSVVYLQTCLRKVPKVSTSALAYYSTLVYSSCTKQTCKAMELSQGQVESLYYSHKQSWQDFEVPDSPDMDQAYKCFCNAIITAANESKIQLVKPAKVSFSK